MTQFEGDLDSTALPEIMQELALRSRTGILTIQGEGDIVAISFLNGEIVAADALNQTVEEGLGKILVQQGLISRQDLAGAVSEQQKSGASLGDHLIGADLLVREELLGALRLQTYGLLRQILAWSKGEFKFYSGDEVAFEEGFAPIAIEELLVRALEDSQGLPGHLVPDLRAVYRRLPAERSPRVIGKDGEVSEEGLWLTESESLLWSKMDGQRTAMSIAQGNGLDHFKAAYSLHRVLQLQLAEKVSDGIEAGSKPDLPRPSSQTLSRPLGAAISGFSPRSRSSTTMRRPTAGELLEDSTAGLLSKPLAERGNELPTLSNVAIFPSDPNLGEAALDPEVEMGSRAGLGSSLDLDTTLGLDSSGLGLRQKTVDHESDEAIAVWHGWLAGALALLLVLGALLTLFDRPTMLAFPAPWQRAEQGVVGRQLRQSQYLRIDRAARTFFLMDAHFPDSLEELVALGLLSFQDLREDSGRLLGYSGEDVSYHVGPPTTSDRLERSETIDGDFHLDSSFAPTQAGRRAPLYLID